MENTAGRYRERISRPSFSAASSSHAGHHAGNGSTAGHAFRSGTPAPALPETPIGKRCHGSERTPAGSGTPTRRRPDSNSQTFVNLPERFTRWPCYQIRNANPGTLPTLPADAPRMNASSRNARNDSRPGTSGHASNYRRANLLFFK